MTITLNGTTGITNVNGTAAAPAITGTDTDSGVYFGTNNVGLSTNGTSALFIDSSQNVGIGTSSPTYGTLEVAQGNAGVVSVINNTAGAWAFRKVRSDGSNGMGIYDATGFGVPAFYAGASERMRIDASGNVLVTNVAGLGYGTGSGGTVTQATSKSTAVTLNKPTGQITMNNAALASSANVSFSLNNTLIAVTDILICTITTAANYSYQIQSYCGAGQAQILLRNIDSVSRSEALVINFAIIKGATS